MKNLFIFVVLSQLSFGALAIEAFKSEIKDGKVEFLAQGPLVKVKGKGEGVKGKIEVGDDMKASGTFTLNLKSLKTGISLRDNHMKNKYLHVEDYPTATVTFKNLEIPQNYKGKIAFKGELNLHNVTKPVSGTVKLKGLKKDQIKFEADLALKFSDFKIPVPKFKLVSLGEEMTVKISSKAKTVATGSKQVLANTPDKANPSL